jgi:hypothetical protein
MNMTEIPQSGAPQPEKVKSMFADNEFNAS